MQGNLWLITAVLLAWSPVVAVLFWRLGKRQGTLIAVVAGALLLPTVSFDVSPEIRLQLTQHVGIGLALLVGMLTAERGALFRFRLRWIDTPMLAYAVFPLFGMFTGERSVGWDVADMLWQRGLGCLVPYAAARRYLGDAEGLRRLGVTIVVATLAYVPLCAFEMVMGPRWYLAGLVYGTGYHEGMVERLGGWRPEGFFMDGISLSLWMASAAVVAFWLWYARLWKPKYGPSWWPAVVLIGTSVACRGVYGYLILAAGLVVTGLTQQFRTRWVLVLLAALAPIYMTLRISGAWDAQVLERAANLSGRYGSVASRLHAEGGVAASVSKEHPVLGFGNSLRSKDFDVPPEGCCPDGLWLHWLWSGGLAGLIVAVSAHLMVPGVCALTIPRRRPSRSEAGSAAWGMVLFVTLHMIHALHNWMAFEPVALAVGSLAGLVSSSYQAEARGRSTSRSEATRPEAGTSSAHEVSALLSGILGVASFSYVFDHSKVEGGEFIQRLGQFTSPVVFAVVGVIASAAGRRFSPSRLAAAALGMALLGASYNMAFHISRAQAASANLFQGLPLCALVVALWSRYGATARWHWAALCAAVFALDLAVRPGEIDLPGSQYLFSGQAIGMSLFPVVPWLGFMSLGPIALGNRPTVNILLALGLGGLGGWLWYFGGPAATPQKFPVNNSYFFLAAGAVFAATEVTRALTSYGPASRLLRWLGRNWLIFFVVHLIFVKIFPRIGITEAPITWSGVTVLGLIATWMVAYLKPWGRTLFRKPYVWLILMSLVPIVALSPSLPSAVVLGLSGVICVLSVAYCREFLDVVLGSPSHAGSRVADVTPALARVVVVLAVLAVPELAGTLERQLRPVGGRPGDPQTPSGRPDSARVGRADGLPEAPTPQVFPRESPALAVPPSDPRGADNTPAP